MRRAIGSWLAAGVLTPTAVAAVAVNGFDNITDWISASTSRSN